jgi:hypothetical protein
MKSPHNQSIVGILIDGFPGIGKCEVSVFTACHPSIVGRRHHTAIGIECMDAERCGMALRPSSRWILSIDCSMTSFHDSIVSMDPGFITERIMIGGTTE